MGQALNEWMVKYPRTPHLQGSRLQKGDDGSDQTPYRQLAGQYLVIEEKMDELIANRIIESDVATSEFEFTQVVEFINRISDNQELKEWIRIQNNFIGVCAGIRKSLSYIEITPVENIATAVRKLESAIGAINVSKVNLGRVRRDVVFRYFSRFEELSELEEFDLLDKVSGWI